MDVRKSKITTANKMFLQWCRDELVLSFIFVLRFVSWDRTRLRKGTTAETQTLAGIEERHTNKKNRYGERSHKRISKSN